MTTRPLTTTASRASHKDPSMNHEAQRPSLLDEDTDAQRPPADRLRPRALEGVVGQEHLLAPDAPIGRMVEQGRLVSAILWGPPGSGKTTMDLVGAACAIGIPITYFQAYEELAGSLIAATAALFFLSSKIKFEIKFGK
ncbi:hypothetical protein [Streptomyces swartbergensis]|uniref:hypothetical protein n=1 Tax=Streptomyces swartbergensis TaxID=487165 RepID=UPI001FCA39A9|nr:hypothetical protein [Streptomyces swartbergensis]